MNKKFLTMAGVVAVISAGTFWGLEIFKPHKVDEVKFPDSVSVDQVFANKLDPEGTTVNQSVAAANAAAANTPAGSDTTAAPAQTDNASGSEAPAASSSDTTASAAETPAEPAAEAANTSSTPAEPTSTGNTTTAAAPAATAATTAAISEPAQTSSPAASSEPAAEPAATANTDTTASAASATSESAAPAAAPSEEAAPAPAPAATSAPVKKHVSHAAKPTHHAAAVASSSTAKTKHRSWWPAENPANLSLVYAGPASFKKAIVLMFNGAFFKTDGLDGNLKVTNSSGQPVSGSWEIGENNRRMLVFPVPTNGQYKISISTGLTDSKGRKVAHSLSGPVTVR